jgi:hypothetical protein
MAIFIVETCVYYFFAKFGSRVADLAALRRLANQTKHRRGDDPSVKMTGTSEM